MSQRILAILVAILAIGCTKPPAPAPTPRPDFVGLRPGPVVVVAARDRATAPIAALAAKTSLAVPEPSQTSPIPVAACLDVDESEPEGLYRHDAFERGDVVLTFDDGPYADRTPKVLDLLAENGFAASFFVLGRHITRNTYDLLQRMHAEGHIIASHSYDHDIRMAHGPGGVPYIRGQHEVTRILIDLALMAASADDFDELHAAVFGVRSDQRLSTSSLRTQQHVFARRHREQRLLRGLPEAGYTVRFGRPPGGGPFLGTAAVPRARYARAMKELGMLNVMWHAQSGDIDATHARNRAFLASNITRAASRGGVLLIHDFIRADALASAFATLAAEPNLRVVPLDEAIGRKYGCDPATLLRPTR